LWESSKAGISEIAVDRQDKKKKSARSFRKVEMAALDTIDWMSRRVQQLAHREDTD
jgi:hypothetical protein